MPLKICLIPTKQIITLGRILPTIIIFNKIFGRISILTILKQALSMIRLTMTTKNKITINKILVVMDLLINIIIIKKNVAEAIINMRKCSKII